MKKNKYNILYTLLLSLLLGGCQDYLDQAPDSSLSVNIQTEEQIAELLTGAYPDASYFSFLEARTDNVSERANGVHSRLNEAMYYWEDFDHEDLDTPLNYWNSCYQGIAQANFALELLAKFPKTDRIKALYGEAFLLRAYLHFMLVNIWSEPYKGEDSKNDLGIPYVTSPEKKAFVKYDRGNVYDVYEKIEKDLKYGITLVKDDYYKNPKFHFNKKAAYAFASRFYLFKGEWDLVIEYANYILTTPKSLLRDWRSYRTQYQFSNPKFLFKRYTNTDETPNLLLTTTESRYARELPIEKYGMNNTLMSTIFGKSFYTFSSSPSPITGGLYISKFDELSLWGNVGRKPKDVYVTNVLLSADEVALNRIEAYVMKQDYNNAFLELKDYYFSKFELDLPIRTVEDFVLSKKTDYNNYYSPFYGLTIKQLGAIKKIANYRQQEFLHEGLRWFDIRRFYLSIKRTSQPLRKSDYRKVIQLPLDAISFGMKPNPRQ